MWGKAKDYSDPKLSSPATEETKSQLPNTVTDHDPKIDIAGNLKNQLTAKLKGKETELCGTTIV